MLQALLTLAEGERVVVVLHSEYGSRSGPQSGATMSGATQQGRWGIEIWSPVVAGECG